jgi:ankyrin repeat protein
VLLEKGADASAQDKDESTPLHWVSDSGQVALVRVLLWGRSRDIKRTLYEGGTCGELAKLLLTHKADVGAQDKYKFSPLHLASGGAGYLASVVALQLSKPNSLAASRSAGFTESLELIRVLLAHGADVRAGDKDNSTPLHWTSGGGYMKLARTLLKRGVDALNRLSFRGCWNLGDIERIHVEVARMLLSADADVNVQDIFGLTPLQRTRRARFFDISHLLLSHNAT